MKIALVHDDLIQWGGAEKVFAEISNIFPDAPIYTALADLKNPLVHKNFNGKKIITSFLQKIPLHKRLYKPLLPLYPIAFEQFDFSDFYLVISHTTRFAKSIITKPETTHVCYIHTPPRFLWNFSGEKSNPLLKPLQDFDKVSSKRVDFWVAGSGNCKTRIKDIYGADSKVLYPFVDTEKFNPSKSFSGNYYLIISRLNKYKKVDIAVEAFRKNRKKLIVVGSGPEFRKLKSTAPDNVQFLGKVNDELLENLLAGCRGLIITAEEDFGMTAIEAQAFGKGVVGFGQGGVRETVANGKTGVYFDKQSVPSLNEAIEKFETIKIDPKDSYENSKKFSKDNFKKELLRLIEG
ncbi:MAG: glycosyltransferase [Bacteriovoracales bacterium]